MFILKIHSSFEDRLFDRIATRAVAKFSISDLNSENPDLRILIKESQKNLTDIENLTN